MFALVIGWLFTLAFSIMKYALILVVLAYVYLALWKFLIFLWKAVHEPSFLWVASKLKRNKKKGGK